MKNKIVKLTEQDLEKLVKKIIKEEGEEYRSEDPNQLDMFDDTKVKDRNLEQEFNEVVGDWRNEIDITDDDDVYEALYDAKELWVKDIYGDYMDDLEIWVYDNEENMNESLFNEANLFMDAMESGMFNIHVEFTKEAKALLDIL